jgi:hypothetical protein
MNFKIGDKIIPKVDGRFGNQRYYGLQIIDEVFPRNGFSDFDYGTKQGFLYKENDIEFWNASCIHKQIKEYGIVNFMRST